MHLSDPAWAQLCQVNSDVNALPYRTDLERWGRDDFWTEIDAAGGDCEDYALEKRRRLRALGWPESALRLAICVDERGEGHGVLTVDTDCGTYALDNRFANVAPWEDLTARGYRWICREAAEGLGWVQIAA